MSENDSKEVSSKGVEFEMFSINIQDLGILIARSIRGNKKLELSASL